MTRLVIIGTGGMGREAAAWAADAGRADDLVGFLDDDPALVGSSVVGLPVLGDRSWLEGQEAVEAVVALGSPSVRAAVVRHLDAVGVPLSTLVHPSAVIGARSTLGEGAIVCPGAVVTVDVAIGRAAILNYGALIGHDVVVGACSFVAPGAHVAGAVTIGQRADLGIGCSVIQGLTIGDDAVVGAGAVVIRDVAPGTTVVGVPASPVNARGDANR